MRTIRVRFTKKDEGAFISLLDLQRVMGRAMKRASIPAWYSKGFNPHMYMSFAAPLALGHYSLCEAMDFKTESDVTDWTAYKEKLSACLPRGLDVISIEDAVLNPDKIAFAEYEISFSKQSFPLFEKSCMTYNEISKAEIEKPTKRGKKIIDLKDYLKIITCEKEKTKLRLPAGTVLNINPELLLEFLETVGGAEKQYASILRCKLITAEELEFE